MHTPIGVKPVAGSKEWREASNGIRPPWSGDESHFLTHCTRCDA
ncbi:hypothetical protein PJ222_06265, partial [Escherichia coli]|nr:hypothetical protein [Escherichia coli]